MRLIDVDKFLENLKNMDNIECMSFDFVMHKMNTQPIAYDVDKVVEQIEELGCKGCEYADDFERCRKDCDYKEISERAIEIIKSGNFEEVIPCEENATPACAEHA